MISSIFTTITEAITAFGGVLVSAFNAITSVFYTTGEGGTYTWTFLGTLILIIAGVALVYMAYRVIRSLFHRVG